MSKYITPAYLSKSFHCPHCGVLAAQTWSQHITCKYNDKTLGWTNFNLVNAAIEKCEHCSAFTIWIGEKMVFPLTGNVELANPDLPEDILSDYNEAKNIVNISPRGAAAILRLAIQKMCIHLGEKGKNLNEDVANLVKKGLPVQLQQALDSVRVIGNHSVHPGVIDLKDKPETAFALFGFVNVICDYFITQPKKIAEIFGGLPEKDKENIAKRDSEPAKA
jgi:hypothetical protein